MPFVAWLDSQAAVPFSDFETEVLSREARRFHGEFMLWLGPSVKVAKASSQRCMVKACFFGAVHLGEIDGMTDEGVVVAADCLPFPSNSIDGLVLHHVLELGADPRAVLREVQRILKPGGRVVVCGFNSLSMWGFLRWRQRFRCLTPLSSIRVQDWISVLGIYRDQPIRYLNCYGRRFRSISGRSFRRLSDKIRQVPFPFGDVYVICGVKQRGAFIPPRITGFSRLPKVGSIGLPRPIARQ